MGSQIKIVVACTVAHFLSYFLLSKLTPYRADLKKYMVVCVSTVTVASLLKAVVLAYFATFLLALYFTRGKDSSHKLTYMLGVVFALPWESGVLLNPGINLGALNYYKVLIFAVLLPVLFFGRRPAGLRRFNTVDIAVFFFVGWQFMLNWGGGNFTSSMRANLWLIVESLLPYWAFRFYLTDHFAAFVAISFSLLAQMGVAILEGLLTWKMYEAIRASAQFPFFAYNMYKFRHGFLRVEAAFSNPLILALFGNLAFLCAYLLYKRYGFEPPRTYKKLWALAAVAVAAAGTFFSGSRAGMAGIVMILVLFVFYSKGLTMRTNPKSRFIALAVASIAAFLTFGNEFIKKEFGYRYQLVQVSWDVVADHFFFGSNTALDDPRMEVLRQGEGIIDLVNTYVYYALYFGMPATISLLIAFLGGISVCFDALRNAQPKELTLGMFALCGLSVLAFNLGTTSPMGWSWMWVWIMTAICSNVAATVTARRRVEGSAAATVPA